MSRLVARILLSLLALGGTALLYTFILVAMLELARYPYRWRTAWITAGLLSWSFLATCWILLWRRSVHWTPSRKRWTLLSAAAAAVLGGAVALLLRSIDVDDDFAFFAFSSASPLLWLVLTIFIWTESAAERSTRATDKLETLICPDCGYDLRGLRAAQCPECGSSFTLDELLARQPGRELHELESSGRGG